MLRWILIELGKLSDRMSKFQPESLDYYDLQKYTPWFNEGCSKLSKETSQIAVVIGSKLNKWG
jgi:hypothetical protein